ncbi:FAD-dependent monooxygenase [Actinorugispora endophytica]|uniref:2-polyprenyl-6-methoxyphenol hydroxylase-like FAD-dependent oxidoreductase n=1 Tax=Actinorugispora endophytica TaxID=1605990 RepID=A0A4V3D7M9_9ACTN|nr:FAD-dependent monooxygenase [Actinorugispora endophytica]TDQ48477.1 2-polyprenyl-6-methoxyphenol hydroxylase-like FAD-dependent oxidoreductase [Actinorugispora endophytica]
MTDPVMIVGAGPVGMVLACELLQQGVPVRLIDAARGHSAHSRATVMWPRLLELLNRTGLSDRLVQSGHRLDGVAYFSSGRPLGTAWMNRLTDTPYPFAVGIPQSTTEEIIEERLAELGGKIEHGTRLVALSGEEGPRPAVVLEHSDGATEEVAPPWLVGADGAHSTLRKLLGISFEGEQFDVSFAITDAEVSGPVPMNVVSYCYTENGSLALGPLGSNVCRVAVSVPHPEDDTPPSREFFQSIVDERAPGRNVLGELRFSTTFRVHARIAERFRDGRFLLAGDSAHIMSPAGAQGMNTGLQDAVNLGWRLGGVLRGALPEDVLTGYDRERRGAAHTVARSTARQTRWGMFRRPAQIAVRDAVFRTATATGLVQRTIAPLIAQTDVRYPPADAAPAARGRRPLPGVRLPVLPTALPPAGRAAGPDGRAWARVAADALTVLLWPGQRPRPGWAGTVSAVRAAASDAAVVEVPAGDGPFAAVLGGAPAVAVVRHDGHLLASLAPERSADLPGVLAALRLRPEPLTDPLTPAAATAARTA